MALSFLSQPANSHLRSISHLCIFFFFSSLHECGVEGLCRKKRDEQMHAGARVIGEEKSGGAGRELVHWRELERKIDASFLFSGAVTSVIFNTRSHVYRWLFINSNPQLLSIHINSTHTVVMLRAFVPPLVHVRATLTNSLVYTLMEAVPLGGSARARVRNEDRTPVNREKQ